MNAICWAHFELGGGRRSLLRWSVTTLLLIIIAVSIQARVGGMLSGNLQVPLSLALLALLVIMVNIRISTAIKKDSTLDMWRSHRLMPQSAVTAVVGFVFGPGLPIFAAAAVVVVAGAVIRVSRSTDPTPWLASCFFITCFAAMTWTFTVAGGIGGSGQSNQKNLAWVPWAIMGPFFGTGGAVLAILPFLAVLASPFSGGTVVAFQAVQDVTIAHVVGAGLHLVVAGLFFTAAVRQYRHAGRPGFSPAMWVFMFALLSVGTVIGVRNFADFRPEFFGGLHAGTNNAVPLTLCLLLFFMVGPLSTAELFASAARLRRNLGDFDIHPRERWLPSPLLAGLLGLMALVPMLALALEVTTSPRGMLIGLTAGCVAMGVVFVWSLVRIFIRLGRRSWIYLVLIGAWAMPLILGAADSLYRTGEPDQVLGTIASLSMPGLLLTLWHGADADFLPGLVFQGLLSVVALLIALRVRDRTDQPIERE